MGESLEQSKSLPITLHQQLASFFLTTLDWLLSDENGTTTVSYSITMQLWYKVTRCINNEDEAAVYEQFNNRIYQLAYEEEGEQLKLYDWWKSYWANIGYKCPNAAIKNISMFLYEIIDRKRSDYIALVTVSLKKYVYNSILQSDVSERENKYSVNQNFNLNCAKLPFSIVI